MLDQLEKTSIYLIYLIAFSGLTFGLYNVAMVLILDPKPLSKKSIKKRQSEIIEDTNNNDQTNLNIDQFHHEEDADLELTKEQVNKLQEIAEKICDGSNVFLLREFLYLLIFVFLFAILIFFVGETKMYTFFTTAAFLIGAFTSMLCGFIGMRIATASNYRTTYSAFFGLGEAFKTAYHGGCVMGFILVSTSLIILMSLIQVYESIILGDKDRQNPDTLLPEYLRLFEALAGYGLGGSTVALFCRVGGGIYTKAADVGADLVSKLEMGLEEDDPRNPAVIADNVGDNVGDIAGMGSDLFGSLAESLTAALLVGATSPELIRSGGYYYPIHIISFGVAASLITACIGFFTSKWIKTYSHLELAIKFQLIISTILIIPCIIVLSYYFIPIKFSIGEKNTVAYHPEIDAKLTMICPLAGLISGLLIGLSTEYYTSMSYGPVKKLVEGCKTGAAINIILGLSLGYISNIIPSILIAGTVLGSYTIAGMYGIALAALGMLSNLPICLAIDAYGPISDNAGGLASMCLLDERIRDRTDELDAAGNTTAAIGKGFAIGSACLVALSLFGAFVTRSHLSVIDVLTPIVLSGLLFGAMIPYLFAALTMKAVGNSAEEMVNAIREDMRNNLNNPEPQQPDSNKCIKIATNSSLSQMFLPGAIVIFIPIILGVLFGPRCVAGLLMGIIISGIQLAISMANSGGAWDNCKKSIKGEGLEIVGVERYEIEMKDYKSDLKKLEKDLTLGRINQEEYEKIKKDLEEQIILMQEKIQYLNTHKEDPEYLERRKLKNKKSKVYRSAEKASITGDTVGDPLKDTSGPSLNILIKLSSIISVVFAGLFLNTSYLIK
jgi:H(+)-translocating pyrophosphatase